ncbi:acyl-CoA dehydrogenase family protein [Sphingobacterium suaedae]|uniref:Acyl-CoA dehydrogenase family protein n=1 Tax=Sphingobacterium suaedae TaxID=1686402 RepID=A0ABW5KEN8_9SPHI
MLNTIAHTDFDTYIASFRARLSSLFNEEYDYNALSLERGLPTDFWNEIMHMNPLSVAIPEIHGGRGALVKECLGVLSAASFESLSLSLIFGINIALFLEPFAKYGQPNVQGSVFTNFLERQAMGGLMITEPAYGSDALNMQTAYEPTANGYRIQGQKHWQGLTGAADYWLVTARRKNGNGDLSRDIDFFLTDNGVEDQRIHVRERYNNLGLYAIPYGINDLDIQVPDDHKLAVESTGIKLMLDTLHRSRLQFPGMGMGFIKRLLDETLEHCKNRRVSGLRLHELDAVKFQLSRLQAAFTLCSGMCYYSAAVSSIDRDLSGHGIDANSVKAFVTDLMQEAAQTSLQLSGAKGYRLDHIAGRSVIDSRPFQIFEGSNEMLYTQIAESIAKVMKRKKETKLLQYLQTDLLTATAAPVFATTLGQVILSDILKQRELIIIGKMIARVVCFQFVISLGETGFNPQLIEITRQHIHMDLSTFVGQLHSNHCADPILEYQENADWMHSL